MCLFVYCFDFVILDLIVLVIVVLGMFVWIKLWFVLFVLLLFVVCIGACVLLIVGDYLCVCVWIDCGCLFCEHFVVGLGLRFDVVFGLFYFGCFGSVNFGLWFKFVGGFCRDGFVILGVNVGFVCEICDFRGVEFVVFAVWVWGTAVLGVGIRQKFSGFG